MAKNFWDNIKDRAIVVRFPYYGNGYFEYKGINIDCNLPLTDKTYEGWDLNDNHYQVEYHRNIVLPALAKLLDFPFDMNDFTLEDRKTQDGMHDISMLYPVKEYRYDVECFTMNEGMRDAGYADLVHNGRGSEYHRLYKYGHNCSRLVNKTLEDGKALLISGDSQLIPDIMPMSVYFKEIWYFDNRTENSYVNKLESKEFDKVLLQIGSTGLKRYTQTNLK